VLWRLLEKKGGFPVKMVKIITDSTADIPSFLVQDLGITVVPSYVTFGTKSYLDGVELSRQQFYERLTSTREIPSTAAPPPAFYEKVYREAAGKKEDIISIHVSSNYSGIYSAARVGASEVEGACAARCVLRRDLGPR
jgi:DegV family protein with EDD domain